MFSKSGLLVLALIAAAPLRAQDEPVKPTDPESPYDNVQVLARAMQLIRQDYVDEKKISYRDLTYSALRGMLADLDPHSQFMEPRDFKGMQEDTRSEFGGLGVVVTMEDGALTIVNPMEDTPGFAAGLKPGDRILRINGTSTENLELPKAVDKLRGDVGEKVTLTIQRPSTKEIKDYELTRVIIKVKSVKDARILPPAEDGGLKIGYVRITQFNEPTAGELAKALEKLEKEGMQALVLDLRYNPGGLLSSAVDVSGLFLPQGTRAVSTEGRTPGREYRTGARWGKPRSYPVAVLVNYASASGSEVVAGALKDLNRAIIVGETTFGKGSVQSVVALPDGSALRLTTAKYFTPGRQVIHEVGVTPNIRATLSQQQEFALLESRRDAAMGGGPVSPEDDPQLARAVDVLRGTLIFAERQQSRGDRAAGKGS
ncbi:MAG TPA: S41 family peptidase [Terrimicrobiaceae bacterium]|nr:S41 family peptidase [Terrimicrobiaceae bacterium]